MINTQDPSTVDEQPTVMCTENTNGRKYNKGTYCQFSKKQRIKGFDHITKKGPLRSISRDQEMVKHMRWKEHPPKKRRLFSVDYVLGLMLQAT